MFHNMISLSGQCAVWVLEMGRKRILPAAASFGYGIIPGICSRIREIQEITPGPTVSQTELNL